MKKIVITLAAIASLSGVALAGPGEGGKSNNEYANPTIFTYLSMVRFFSSGGTGRNSRPKATFDSTVRQGSRANSWKTTARSDPGEVTFFPSI